MQDTKISKDFYVSNEVAPGIARLDFGPAKIGVPCLICGNVLETYYGHYNIPYICDDCKEAIVYAKRLMKENKAD